MDKRGMNVPQASGSRKENLLAGLGRLVMDNFTGKRSLMLDEARQRSRAEVDVARQLSTAQGKADIAEQTLLNPNFKDVKQVAGLYEKQSEAVVTSKKETFKPEKGETPLSTELSSRSIIDELNSRPQSGNKKGPQFNQPTTEDVAPAGSTSKMRGSKNKKPSAKIPTPSGKPPRKREGTIADTEAAVKSQKITKDEGIMISKGYAAKQARANVGKKTSTPKPIGKPKNGNSGSTNGNKKGGM